MKPTVEKQFLKTLIAANYYRYELFLITVYNDSWLEAVPVNEGVTRVGKDETLLKEQLYKDALYMNRYWVRQIRR